MSFRKFSQARRFARSLQLNSSNKWGFYSKSGNKPKDIPSCPNEVYENKGWKTWGDWLGNGQVSPSLRIFRSFKEAKKFAHSLKLPGQFEWFEFTKSKKRPKDIPTAPQSTYKKEWKGWGDWLGTGRIANKTKHDNYRKFHDARAYARTLELNDKKEWENFVKSGKLPPDIPKYPWEVYENKGWKNLGDFLGTKLVVTYALARKKAISRNIQTAKEWQKFVESDESKNNYHLRPDQVYKNKGWTTWGEFLGTGRVLDGLQEFLPFEEAKKIIQSKKIKSYSMWMIFTKSEDFPSNIPVAANSYYKNKGWITWGDFLGTGQEAWKNKNWEPYKEAKKIIQKLAKKYKIRTKIDWNKFTKSGKLPRNIPASPWIVYTKERVSNWRT